ncbi:thymidylate kinase [Kitasatospora sp. NPDC086791]|uniref:dTMP kinase n=1 Tax=Kitasatospora sp. NPDC086791 TaxID=3155178 RepID=UPI003424C6F1
MPITKARPAGVLVSTEGLSGVGKSHLTALAARLLDADLLCVEEFSRRRHRRDDLGSRIITAMVDAAAGDHFLRAGLPASETLLLLAVQMHTWETTWHALAAGTTVIEGRSLHSVAVYQAVVLHPDDDRAALNCARRILAEAAAWRPLPDLVILLTDDPGQALTRAEQRDRRPFTPDELAVHHRSARLFEALAADDPHHVRVLDRRAQPDPEAGAELMADWIRRARPRQRHPGLEEHRA